VLHGSKGSFIKPRTDVQEAMLQAGKIPGSPDWGTEPETEKGLLHTERAGKEIREYLPSMKGNYMNFYDGMYNAIRNYEPVPVAAEDGLKVIRVIETAYESSQKKKVIEFH
jgi:predicted dehydrogenase